MNLGHVLFSFKGRIDRQMYWLATVVLMVIAAVAQMVARATGDDALALRLAARAVSLVMLYCATAVGAKRWHDRDKSAWWVLLGFVPLVGQVWTIVELGFLRGTPGANRFGPATSGGLESAPPAIGAAAR